MENPDFIYYIPVIEGRNVLSLLDAIKIKILEDEKSGISIFTRGPGGGFCIEVVHPDFNENKPKDSLTIHISCERFQL